MPRASNLNALLPELKAREAAMTPAPWRPSEGRAAAYGPRWGHDGIEPVFVFGGADDADRDGLIALRNAAPVLLSTLEEQAQKIGELEREISSCREVADPDDETPELSLRDRIMHVGEQAALLVTANRSCERRGARIRMLEEMLRTVLASAYPNEHEHPTMFEAWTKAEALLAVKKG